MSGETTHSNQCHTSQCVIDASHPSLPGHFPGDPVVPGVVILDEVLHALAEWQPQAKVTGFTTVKFLQPLLPEESFSIEFQAAKTGRLKFECKKNQNLFANGVISLATDTA